MLLSGTFGELRGDHFHSGIDIKTGGVSGKNIYAIADGYVSRIKISPYGFGKALYVTHPNGYTSVYGHLKVFRDDIWKYIVDKQYERKSFAIDVPVEKDLLVVKKGEVIALSGNSGSSAGPHLHFEIREELDQTPLNPLLFGYEIKDWIRPKILSLRVYPITKNSFVNMVYDTVEYQIEGWGPVYRLKSNDTIKAFGEISFGIITYDLLNDAKNKNGAFSIEMLIDSNLVYSINSEKFSFAETRYINSLIDYSEYIKSNRRYITTYRAPNNRLSIYKSIENEGVFSFDPGKVYKLQYVVKDINDNTSILTFYVKGEEAVKSEYIDDYLPLGNEILKWNEKNEVGTSSYKLTIPANALYDDLNYTYSTKKGTNETIGDIHRIHNRYTPMHAYSMLSLKFDVNETVDASKAYIAKLNGSNASFSGGNYEDGFLTTRIRSFGDYCIMIDTISPVVKPLNFHNNKDCSQLKCLKVKIEDGESGIDLYEGFMNDEWILFDYDPKQNLLTYEIDGKTSRGVNDLVISVTDRCGNITTVKSQLIFR